LGNRGIALVRRQAVTPEQKKKRRAEALKRTEKALKDLRDNPDTDGLLLL